MKKNLLITHTDLDGISPIILLNLTGEKFLYKSIEISDVDTTFDELFTSGEINEYENIYVTDLTLTPHVYELLNNSNLKVLVFDHHNTHLFANEYPYVTVNVELDGRKTCGTELFYRYLLDKYKDIMDRNIVKDYVELVRQKDVYEFTSEKPKELEMLMNVYGKYDFIKFMTRRLKKDKNSLEFSAFEKRYLKLTTEERERYIAGRELKMKRFKIKDLTFGLVWAERYKDDLGNYLSLKYPELDGIILINAAGGVSYRTSRDDVDLSAFAYAFGGGGHKKASGSRITDEDKLEFIKYYFKDVEEIIVEENNESAND